MKYYVLEYTHDECGASVSAVPNSPINKKSKDYFKREICYINLATEGITLNETYITIDMFQELSRHIPELIEYYKNILDAKNKEIIDG